MSRFRVTFPHLEQCSPVTGLCDDNLLQDSLRPAVGAYPPPVSCSSRYSRRNKWKCTYKPLPAITYAKGMYAVGPASPFIFRSSQCIDLSSFSHRTRIPQTPDFTFLLGLNSRPFDLQTRRRPSMPCYVRKVSLLRKRRCWLSCREPTRTRVCVHKPGVGNAL